MDRASDECDGIEVQGVHTRLSTPPARWVSRFALQNHPAKVDQNYYAFVETRILKTVQDKVEKGTSSTLPMAPPALRALLSGAKSSFPQSGAACAGLQRAHTGRQAPGHLGEIPHRPWVLCPALCLVHIAACRCACPLPQAPPALRALCRGWIQRACTGQQAPVDPRDTSLGP